MLDELGIKLIVFGFTTAFFVVLLATPSLIKVAKIKHLVDEPIEKRKKHRRSIPTLGGVIIFGAVLFSYALWYPDDYLHIPKSFSNFKFLVASLILLFFIGVKDDIFGTASIKKLIAHMMVAFILVMMAEIKIHSMEGIFGVYELDEWQSAMLSVFAYIVIVNAYNLIDGVDGLAGGFGFIACFIFGVWFVLTGNVPLAMLSFVLAGALAAFLVFNFSPAKIFMGDSGSLVTGAILSVLAISAINEPRDGLPDYLSKVHSAVFAMAVLAYPLLDTFRVFTYRAFRGVSPFSADRNHLHHNLGSLGLGDVKTVTIIYSYSIYVVVGTIVLSHPDPTCSFLIGFAVAWVPVMALFFMKKRMKIG